MPTRPPIPPRRPRRRATPTCARAPSSSALPVRQHVARQELRDGTEAGARPDVVALPVRRRAAPPAHPQVLRDAIMGERRRARRAAGDVDLAVPEAPGDAGGGVGVPRVEEAGRQGRAAPPPTPGEVADEFEWVLDRTVEHLGERAGRYLRKHYPWYVERLAEAGVGTPAAGGRTLPDKRLQEALQQTDDVELARALVRGAVDAAVPA